MLPPKTCIRTANYLSLKKSYLDEVVLPVLADVRASIIPVKRYIEIGGKRLCLQAYSEGLAELVMRALGCREIMEPAQVDVTISLWDSASTQTVLASPGEGDRYAFTQQTETQQGGAEAFVGVYLYGEETVTLYDRAGHEAYFWLPDARRVAPWIIAAPLRTLLHWILAESQISLVHGAVVGRGQQAILLTAKGGSGKSSTALACVRAGMTYLGDDYVALQSGAVPVAHSLYTSVKVRIDQAQGLFAEGVPTDGEKRIFFLDKVFPKQMQKTAILRAMVIPVIARAKQTTIVPVSTAQMMLALIPTTIFQLPLASTQTLALLTDLIRKTPCYRMELSEDPQEIAAAMDAFFFLHTQAIV